jgi:predicted amidohydrolase
MVEKCVIKTYRSYEFSTLLDLRTEIKYGNQTKERIARILGKKFVATNNGNLPQKNSGIKEPEIITKFIKNRTQDEATVILAQLDYRIRKNKKNETFGYYLLDKEELQAKIMRTLEIAVETKADLVIFPEFCYDEELAKNIKHQFHDSIIIFGSRYNKGYNECSVILYGTELPISQRYRKINGSPGFEEDMIPGNNLFVYQTHIGNIAVLLCNDYRYETGRLFSFKHLGVKEIDIIAVPQFNDAIDLFQEQASVDCEKPPHYPYIIQVNACSINGIKGGRSSICCSENNNNFGYYEDHKYIKKRAPKNKVLELNLRDEVVAVKIDIKEKKTKVPNTGPKIEKIYAEII